MRGLKKIAWEGDNTQTNIQTSQLYERIGLRADSLKIEFSYGVTSNFKAMNQENFLCPICEQHPDTKQHVSLCQILQVILPRISRIVFSGLFGYLVEQKEFIIVVVVLVILFDCNTRDL